MFRTRMAAAILTLLLGLLVFAVAPRSVQAQAELGDVLRRLPRPEESREAFQKALDAAKTIHPELQSGWLPRLKKVALEVR